MKKTEHGYRLLLNIFCRPTIMVIGLTVVLAAVGCDKKKAAIDEIPVGAFARPTAQNTARPAEEKAPAPPARVLPKADLAVPLASYAKLEGGTQLMFMYHALSEKPLDYEKIANAYSRDFQNTSDGFKRQDMLAALKPKIDAEIQKYKGNRYFVHTIKGPLGSSLQTYDFTSKSFPVDERIWSSDARSYFMDNPYYEFSFSNGEEFKALRVEDSEAARKIEAMISGYKDARVVIYAFAQDADPAKNKILAQIVKMQFTDSKGNELVVK